jgi:hypothetical protein
VAKHPHLYRRQAVYWWRRRIPKHLRQFFSTSEIRVSLRAHMAQEAATRAARLRVVTDLAFQDLERAVTTGLTLPEQTFDQLVNQLVQDELDRCERERELAGPRTEADIQQAVLDHQRQRARLQQALRYNAYDELEQQLLPAVASVQAVATEQDLAVLRRRAARGLLQATYVNEARELGLYDKPSEANANVAVNASTGSFPGRQLHVPACPTVAEPTGGTLSRGPGRTPAAATGGENVVSLKRKGATQSIASANTATPATGAGTGPTSKYLKRRVSAT